MNTKKIKNNRGFTIIELVVALAILAAIFSLVGPFFITGIQQFQESNSRVIDQANLRKIMASVSREVRDATELTITDNGQTVTIDGNIYTYNATDETLVKTVGSTGDEVTIAKFITWFEVERDGDMVTIKARATNRSSILSTNVYVREKPSPTAVGGYS